MARGEVYVRPTSSRLTRCAPPRERQSQSARPSRVAARATCADLGRLAPPRSSASTRAAALMAEQSPIRTEVPSLRRCGRVATVRRPPRCTAPFVTEQPPCPADEPLLLADKSGRWVTCMCRGCSGAPGGRRPRVARPVTRRSPARVQSRATAADGHSPGRRGARSGAPGRYLGRRAQGSEQPVGWLAEAVALDEGVERGRVGGIGLTPAVR